MHTVCVCVCVQVRARINTDRNACAGLYQTAYFPLNTLSLSFHQALVPKSSYPSSPSSVMQTFFP